MTPADAERSSAVDSLYFRWHAFRAAGRNVSAEALCRDRPELVAELVARLAAEQPPDELDTDADRTGGYTPSPASATRDDPPPDTAPDGTGGGRFAVLSEIARGGMGRVCAAIDTELNRRVAFKDIQGRFADDPLTRHRFTREALITGQLEHPGVIPVYGLGTDADGRPYYAMRFVEGDSLKAAVKAFHEPKLARPPVGAKAVAFRGLLKRFADVCNAVAFAHSKRIVHRDLKPANVMLGPFGETLVVDWGLARSFHDKAPEPAGAPPANASAEDTTPGTDAEATAVRDDALGTRTGQMMGTPAYMSPEQAAGKLGTLGPAWDIYSLGATLYDVLTGRPPYTGKSLGELFADIQAGDFPAPRAVAPWVPKPLEAVVLKAMAKEPAERYGAALELAAEIDRYLADEPVQAHRDSFGERVRRWARRNRGWVRAGATAVGVVLVVLAVSLFVVNAAREEAVESERLKTGALNRESKANGNLRSALAAEQAAKAKARAALDTATDEVLGKLLGKLDRLGPDDEAFLKKLIATYDELAADPDDRALAAAARARIGELYRSLGDVDSAAKSFAAAIQILSADAADPLSAASRDLGSAKLGFARTATLSDPAGAVRAMKEALLLREEALKRQPADPQRQEDLAVVLLNAAEMMLVGPQQNAVAAEAMYRRIVSQFLPVVAINPDGVRPAIRDALGKGLDQLALLNERKRPANWDEAYRCYDNALRLFGRLKEQVPTDPRYAHQWANSLASRAMVKARDKKWREVIDDLTEATAASRRIVEENPSVRDFRQAHVMSVVRLAEVLNAKPEPTPKEAGTRLKLLDEAFGHLTQLRTRYPTLEMYGEMRKELGGKLVTALRAAGRTADADEFRDRLQK